MMLGIVSHCDPTVVLYPQFVCVRGDVVEEYWAITPRHDYSMQVTGPG
jgi:hypothetical protein